VTEVTTWDLTDWKCKESIRPRFPVNLGIGGGHRAPLKRFAPAEASNSYASFLLAARKPGTKIQPSRRVILVKIRRCGVSNGVL